MDILWWLLVGLVAGWLAGMLMKGRGFGVIGNIIVGILGAIIGGAVLRAVGLFPQGVSGALISAFIGAVVLLFLISLINKT